MFHHASRSSQNKVSIRHKKDAPSNSTKVTKRKKTTTKSEVEPIEIEPWLQRQRKWRRRKERKPIQEMATYSTEERSLSRKRRPANSNFEKNFGDSLKPSFFGKVSTFLIGIAWTIVFLFVFFFTCWIVTLHLKDVSFIRISGNDI